VNDRSLAQATGISVIVPAYRSPGTLETLCRRLRDTVAPLTENFEVILIDDGSGDDTWPTIRRLAADNDWVVGLTLLRNYGQHNALLAGLRAATMPIIVTLDDDLQNPPEQVPLLLEALSDEFDLVYGRPRNEQQGIVRNAASRITKRAMAAALGPDVYPRSSAFRVFRRELVKASAAVHDPYISIDVLLSWATNRVTDVEVEFASRAQGNSGYTTRQLVRHAVNMITGYSVRPLRWMSMFGLLCAAIGFALLFYVILSFLLGDASVAGFTFLAAAITLFSGVQLLSLGILGEYVGRMHFRTMGKPPYAIREATFDISIGHAPPEERTPMGQESLLDREPSSNDYRSSP